MKSSDEAKAGAVPPEVIEQCFVFEAWEIYGIDIKELDQFIETGPLLGADRISAKADRARASALYANKNFEHAMEVIRILLTIQKAVENLAPAAAKGKRFMGGKPKGSLEPIQKAIKKYLTKHPEATAADVWSAISRTPPKGCEFIIDARNGDYVLKPNNSQMARSTFINNVSIQRKKLTE